MTAFNTFLRGKHCQIKCCLNCGKVMRCSSKRCPRCFHRVSVRTNSSLAHTSALLITSLLLYIPANLLPMMVFHNIGGDTSNTIMGGIMVLFNGGLYSIALIVFVASIIIPIFKIIGLSILVIATKYWKPSYIQQHMRLYRFIEKIGRWSMLDVFVISIMLTLLNFSPFVTITIGWGTSAFGAVVIITMMAAKTFDPRLLWDAVEEKSYKEKVYQGELYQDE